MAGTVPPSMLYDRRRRRGPLRGAAGHERAAGRGERVIELAQEGGDFGVVEATEGAAGLGAVEHGHLEVFGRDGAIGPAEGGRRPLEGVAEGSFLSVRRLHAFGDGLGLAAEDGVAA